MANGQSGQLFFDDRGLLRDKESESVFCPDCWKEHRPVAMKDCEAALGIEAYACPDIDCGYVCTYDRETQKFKRFDGNGTVRM